MKTSISVIGERRKVALELQGDVLILHHRTLATSSLLYVPGEWIRIAPGEKKDLRRFLLRLTQVLSLSLVLFLLGALRTNGLSSALWRDYLIHRVSPFDIGLVACCTFLAFVGICLSLHQFLQPRSLIQLTASSRPPQDHGEDSDLEEDQEEEDEIELDFEFWHSPGKDKVLDALIERFRALPEEVNAKRAYPIKVGYMWEHIRPWQAALTIGVRGTIALLLLYTAARLILRVYYGEFPGASPWFLAVPALPWVFGGLLLLIDAIRLRFEPEGFRQGMRHYYREEFGQARQAFLQAHRAHPDHEDTLVLLVQLCTQAYDFEKAFHFCGLLGRFAPDMADSLQENIWSLKRLRERMHSTAPAR